jgi:hypothetical protein
MPTKKHGAGKLRLQRVRENLRQLSLHRTLRGLRELLPKKSFERAVEAIKESNGRSGGKKVKHG